VRRQTTIGKKNGRILDRGGASDALALQSLAV
jgi:hypothetical protein